MTVQCTGTTEAENQCKHRVKIGDRCKQHPLTKTSKSTEVTSRCIGIKKDGTRCKRIVRGDNKCPSHTTTRRLLRFCCRL